MSQRHVRIDPGRSSRGEVARDKRGYEERKRNQDEQGRVDRRQRFRQGGPHRHLCEIRDDEAYHQSFHYGTHAVPKDEPDALPASRAIILQARPSPRLGAGRRGPRAHFGAAFAVSRAMRSLLFAVAPDDDATYRAVLMVVLIVVAIAAYLPRGGPPWPIRMRSCGRDDPSPLS